MMEMDGKTEALFTHSTAQTKLRRNLPQLKLASNVSALHSAGFGQSTAIDMAERYCFPACFVSAPSLIVHNASVFPGGSGEKQVN